jgi:hypothetical protein
MGIVNAAIGKILDLLLAPFAGHLWLGMGLISLLTGFLLLLIFRLTSNQQGIKRAKDRILAHLLEVLFFRDEMRLVLRAQLRLLLDNARYLGYALVPLVFMLIPVGLLLMQLELRYGYRPLQVGERTILAVKFSQPVDLDRVSLQLPSGVTAETDSLRMPELREVDWRLRAEKPGDYQIKIQAGGEIYAKRLVVGKTADRISSRRVEGGVWPQFINPGEAPLPAKGKVAWINVTYPLFDFPLGSHKINWIWAWLILSMVFGYAFKGPLRVQV